MMQTGKHWLGYICFDAALMVLSFSYARAQNTVDEVHVASNEAPVYAAGFPSLSKENAGLIRKSVELVLVPVTVMDQGNRFVTGLQEDNFHLYEDKHPQPIKNFWKEDEPVSVGVVLDVSGSMKDKLERAQDAVKALLDHSNPATMNSFCLRLPINQAWSRTSRKMSAKSSNGCRSYDRRARRRCSMPLSSPQIT